MDKYSEEAIKNAAKYAYQHSPAGDNTDYVERKTQQFIERCKNCNFGREIDSQGNITRTAIETIAYSALDEYTEQKLWQHLSQHANKN